MNDYIESQRMFSEELLDILLDPSNEGINKFDPSGELLVFLDENPDEMLAFEQEILNQKNKNSLFLTYKKFEKKALSTKSFVIDSNPSKPIVNQSKNVVIDNKITRSAQHLTLIEKRVIALALTKIDQLDKLITLSVDEYVNTFGGTKEKVYDQLLKATNALQRKSFTIYTKESFDDIDPLVTKYNWTSKAQYQKGNGYLAIQFNPLILPFLQMLSENFTKYQISQVAQLTSIYSWRLLELLEQMRKSKCIQKDHQGNIEKTEKIPNGWLRISVEEFHHAMETTESAKKDFAKLRTNILEPAIKELQEKDHWKIEYEPIKRGRKVIALNFRFERNGEQGELF